MSQPPAKMPLATVSIVLEIQFELPSECQTKQLHQVHDVIRSCAAGHGKEIAALAVESLKEDGVTLVRYESVGGIAHVTLGRGQP